MKYKDYIASLPSHWKAVPLGEIFEFKNGINFTAAQKGAGILTVDVLNMYSAGLYVDTTKLYRVAVDVSDARALHPGDILFVRSSVKEQGIGWPAIFSGCDEAVAHCGFLIQGRPIANVVEPRFLVRFLRQQFVRDQMISSAGKTAITNISQERLKELVVPVPPLAEQKRVADILDLAESLHNKRQQALQSLEHLILADYFKMFGDPVTNERQWNCCSLKEVVAIARGRFSPRPRNDPQYYGGEYPFIQTGDVVRAGLYVRTHTQTLNEKGLRVSKKFPPGTIVITIAANIGETAILTYETCFPDSVVGLQCNPQFMVPEFLRYQLVFLKSQLINRASQTAQKNINVEILNSFPVASPPLELQVKFAEVVAQSCTILDRMRKQQVEIDNLSSALQQQAFCSGFAPLPGLAAYV